MILSTIEHHKVTTPQGCKVESVVTPTHEHVTMECPLQVADDKPGKQWPDNRERADRVWWRR